MSDRIRWYAAHYKDIALLKRIHGDDAEFTEITEADLTEAYKHVKSIKLESFNNKVILGRNDTEVTIIEKINRKREIKRKLAEIDKKTGAGRAVRGLELAAAESLRLTGNADYAALHTAEETAVRLRAEMARINEELGAINLDEDVANKKDQSAS